MPETRLTRTDFLGLLAVMQAYLDVQNWTLPYWDKLREDAQFAALHDAPRTGTALLAAPAGAPTLALVAGGGYLPAGQTVEIVQTFVDPYGRETAASPTATLSTGAGITDPEAALAVTSVSEAASGYEGGDLKLWYSWTDGNGGETLPSPLAETVLPYRAGGLKSQVEVALPSTPAGVGAAGANIYLQHRDGNIVQAYRIEVDSVDHATLTGAVANCYLALPQTNTTGAGKAVNITGQADPSGQASYTRFYARLSGEDWETGDHRVKVGAADQWEPLSVTYPLLWLGGGEGLRSGYPPPLSQVKSIRPVDLATEAVGVLPASSLPPEAVTETELVKSTGEGVISGLSVGAAAPAAMSVVVGPGEAMQAGGRRMVTGVDLTIPAADPTNPRIDLIVLTSAGLLHGPSEDSNLKGTPAQSPVCPAVPSGALALAEVLVPAGDTTIEASQITDRRYLLPAVKTLNDDLVEHASDPVHASASIAETNAGIETTKKVTPDGLAGSYAGTKSLSIVAVEQATDVTTGAKMQFVLPPALDGMNLIYANGWVNTAGTTNATTVHIYSLTKAVNLLSSPISVASGETIGTPGTIDLSHDDVAGGDVLRVDVVSESTTPAKGLMVVLEFRKP